MSLVILGTFLALISAICWGAGGVIFKLGLRNVSEYSGNLIRSVFAVAFLLPLVVIKGIEPLSLKLVMLIVISTVFSFFIGDLLYFTALKNSPVSYALPLASTYPVFVAVMDNLVYGYAVTTNVIAASILTLLAVIVLPKEGGKFTLKSLTALFASLSWAVSIVTLDYLTDHLSPVTLAFLRLLLNSAMLYAMVRRFEVDRNTLLYMGLLGGLISVTGILSFVTSVSLIGSNMVSPISATSPVIGAMVGKVFLKEKLTVRHGLAMGLVFASVIALSLRPR
ncbi:DMT family transporter [Geoglobus sp.]